MYVILYYNCDQNAWMWSWICYRGQNIKYLASIIYQLRSRNSKIRRLAEQQIFGFDVIWRDGEWTMEKHKHNTEPRSFSFHDSGHAPQPT